MSLTDAAETSAFSFVTYAVLIPLVCAIGLLGNGLALFIVGRKSTESSMFGYLTSLSIADIGFLIANLVECYFLMGQNGKLYHTETGV